MRKRKQVSEIQNSTFLAKGVSIEGELKASGVIILEGELKGDVLYASKLEIRDFGRLIGNINVEVAEINGFVEGDVIAGGMILLKAGAEVKGDLYTNKLIIEQGAFFSGISKMSGSQLSLKEIPILDETQSIAANA